ncbi:MAG: DNA alkylation repair protein [Pseudomonadota bacterium]
MSIKAEKNFSLKDQLFNEETVSELADALGGAHRQFDRAAFLKQVLDKFPELELKARIAHIVDVLGEHLPAELPKAIKILEAALPEPLDPTKTDDDFGTFIWAVPGEYVARHGCNDEYFELSLRFLREATKRFTSENPIRPFLKQFNARTMAFVHECTSDENYHVRRLASEGIRPFLPWAPRADVAVDDILLVLDKLYLDETRYVTRSVANTLNDIAKIEPDKVVDTLARWNASTPDNKEVQWLTKHALRTLLKDDFPDALSLLGYAHKPSFKLVEESATKPVKVGEDFRWSCRLESKKAQLLKVTLKVYFLKANGSHSTKVFAIKDATFKKGETLNIQKKQSFKPITTRTLYPGEHKADLVINGVVAATVSFDVIE